MNPELAELLQRIAQFFAEFEKLANDSGYDSVGEFLDAILTHDEEQPSQVGWPPPLTATIEKVGTDDDFPVYELILHNVDRDITSFEVDMTDFDPEGDGAVNLRWAVAGKELAELHWFFGANRTTGRYGAFQSVIQEYDDNPEILESITLMRFSMDRDDEFTFYELGVGGNYDKGAGVDEHFTYHDFTDVTYIPEG